MSHKARGGPKPSAAAVVPKDIVLDVPAQEDTILAEPNPAADGGTSTANAAPTTTEPSYMPDVDSAANATTDDDPAGSKDGRAESRGSIVASRVSSAGSLDSMLQLQRNNRRSVALFEARGLGKSNTAKWYPTHGKTGIFVVVAQSLLLLYAILLFLLALPPVVAAVINIDAMGSISLNEVGLTGVQRVSSASWWLGWCFAAPETSATSRAAGAGTCASWGKPRRAPGSAYAAPTGGSGRGS